MRKSTLILMVIAMVAILALSGCMTTFSTTNGKLAYADVSGTSKGQIEVDKSYIYFIHPELATFGDGKTWEELDKVLEPELAANDANAITDMSIKNGFTGTDYLLSMFVPFVSWGTYVVEGTAVQQ